MAIAKPSVLLSRVEMLNKWIASLLVAACMSASATAQTLRMAIADDATTLDPHSANILGNTRLLASIYEGLVTRDKDFKVVPALAVSWNQPDAKTWRFKLRPNVKFHDGSPFTADDVVFSVERVLHPLSSVKSSIQGVSSAKRVDDLTVDSVMSEPNPVLLLHLVNFRIMSKAWSSKNNALTPQNYKDKEDTVASRSTNGTGPYMLVSRQPDVKTVLTENKAWWNRASKDRGNVVTVEWTPIKQPSTRMAALLSGTIDFVIDPPFQDRERVKNTPGLKLTIGSEPRIYFVGFDLFRDELQYSNVKGKNPFKDVRVRQAISLVIDTDLIVSKVTRGYARPTPLIIGKEVQGYAADLDKKPKVDIARAKKLMAEAGYPSGFEVTIDCSNQVPFGEICQAMAPMLSQIGIKLMPNIMINTNFPPKIQRNDFSMHLWGWGSTTDDSLYVLQSLVRSVGAERSGDGEANYGRYSNPKLDALIDRMKTETDMAKRDAIIREALVIQREELPVLPLAQVVVAWAMRKNVDAPFAPNNLPYFYRFRMN
ncbi:MAG: ABC transporter substrate-binding protein [Rhodocyclaceae bacterium]|nr:ABC transporter substrate-binding protein [Rhodocyclaceae bacterium]MCA3026574.1 ABC transporter substrate-binding protein [Rhodocyclaceae bacterium]MCA3033411.1 ABC transporter substrate-binding protein [Rhodocyclaceae bacterium]MCA3038004.1 ABC transporter substrate-binding protein [Rhodocyclaceae bacterium]MCA3046016.1 ABC transporter substrate-binding protein [Rhodocyclaceae bacterium]